MNDQLETWSEESFLRPEAKNLNPLRQPQVRSKEMLFYGDMQISIPFDQGPQRPQFEGLQWLNGVEIPGQPISTTTHTFGRIQFKKATANNEKRRAAQQHFILRVELLAEVFPEGQQSPTFIKVAQRRTCGIVVRGRSPGHYQDERRMMSFSAETSVGSPSSPTATVTASNGKEVPLTRAYSSVPSSALVVETYHSSSKEVGKEEVENEVEERERTKTSREPSGANLVEASSSSRDGQEGTRDNSAAQTMAPASRSSFWHHCYDGFRRTMRPSIKPGTQRIEWRCVSKPDRFHTVIEYF
ncbi:hypothetical protein MMC10_004958 [Thelotrema lepadinum]|nr:hypothetical protein [Thelotrema lepadinum]